MVKFTPFNRKNDNFFSVLSDFRLLIFTGNYLNIKIGKIYCKIW